MWSRSRSFCCSTPVYSPRTSSRSSSDSSGIFRPGSQAGQAFLREWIAAAQESGIKRLARFAKTLHDHWEGLLAYFDHPITTEPLEGVNNSIKVLKRKAYGYRDVGFFKLRILFIHECKSKFVGA